MGTTCSAGNADEEYKLNVMTLNYCGITSSPFEFYLTEYEPQLKRIGQFFKQLCEKELDGYLTNSNLKNLFGNIEFKFKKERYSPLFRIDAGIRREIHEGLSSNCYAESEEQFRANWEHSFWQFINKTENGKIKTEWQRQPNIQTYKRNVCKFDFLMLKALLKYVFREKTFEECTKRPIDIDRYNRIMKPFFEMSFLQEQNKLSQFKYGFIKTQPDLFFIQECSPSLITFLNARTKKNYIFYHARGQAIIFKKDKFISETDFKILDIESILKKDEPEIQKLEDKTPRKILAVQSNNYLFLCLHLTSRPKENSLQKEYLKELFVELQRNLHYKDKIIIAGGDINSFEKSFPPGYDFYPKNPEDITTFKKRTPMQAQKNKIDDVIKRSIDKIITNKKISEGSITLIDGSKPAEYEQGEKERRQKKQGDIVGDIQEGIKSNVKILLPCDIHPFDQFLVKTTLTFASEFNPNQQQTLRSKAKI